MFRFPRLAVACASLLLVAPNAVATKYSFINIADSRGPLEGFAFIEQAVSDTGAVAFIGYQGEIAATYLGSGGAVQQVVPNLGSPAGFSKLGYWALNASAVAAGVFDDCCNPRHDLIQLYNASGASTVAEIMGGETFDAGFGYPAISNSGAAAFPTYMSDNTPSRQGGLIGWVNGSSTTLVDFEDGFHNVFGVALNEQDDVAFAGAMQFQGEFPGASVYRTDGATLTPIGGLFQTIGTTAINESGAVAFWALLDSGGEGLFVGDGGPLTTVAIADPTTPFYEFQDDMDINNQGTVAFTARLWDGTFGIFAGDDPVNDKVVQIGDLLFGQRVSGLGRPHLNNRGDMAFWFEVLDPRVPNGHWSGIALAVKQAPLPGDFNGDGTVDAADYVVWRKNDGTPDGYNTWRANFGHTAGLPSSAVPEPATLTLLMIAAFGIRLLWPVPRETT